MTTVAVTRETTASRTRKSSGDLKATLELLVVQLKSELDQTKKNIASLKSAWDSQVQGFQELLASRNADLKQKSDALTQALNERDVFREELDSTRRWVRDYERSISELRKDLRRLSEANANLTERNQENLKNASRNGDVAAVLASILAATNTPADVMLKFAETADHVGIAPDDILDEVQIALKRGYAMQVEHAISGVVSMQY